MRKTLLFLGIFSVLALFLGSRLIFIQSGIHISEPDELSYDVTSQSVTKSFIPIYAGRPFLEQTPIFEYLAAGMHMIVHDSVYPRTFVSTRLIAVLSSLALALALFWYLRKKEDTLTAVFGFVLFTITPITLFYSKVGLREMLVMLMMFLFYISFESLKTNPTFTKATISGTLLGLSIAVKTTALVLLGLPILYSLISLFDFVTLESRQFNTFQIRAGKGKNWKKGLWYNLTVLAFGISIPALLFAPYAVIYPTFFKDRVYLTLFAHNIQETAQKFRTISYYLKHVGYWLSIPVILSILIGIVTLVRTKRFDYVLLLFTILPFIPILINNEARGRYFVLITPFLIVLAAVGLRALITLLARMKVWGAQVVVPLLFLGTMVPSIQTVFQSSQHSVIEQGVRYLREHNDGRMVFSTFWPPIIQYDSGMPTIRFTDDIGDAWRDHNEFPSFSPLAHQNPTEYIGRNNAFVLVLKPMDQDDFSERKRAVTFLEGNFKPSVVFEDNKPNFPEFVEPYKLYVYNRDSSPKEESK